MTDLLADRSARLFDLCALKYGDGPHGSYGDAWRCANLEIGPLAPQERGAVCITDSRRKLHRTAELIAVFGVVPFMGWLALNRNLPPWARVTSAAIAVGTLAVDGYLAFRYTPMP